MRRSKTIGLLAFVAGATALLYKPAMKLIRELADNGSRRKGPRKSVDDQLGKFANHYLGSNRHHARAAKHHKSTQS